LSMAIEIELTLPPSMRSNAIKCPDSSQTAMHMGMFIASDLATAPSMSTSASSRESLDMVSMGSILHQIGGFEIVGEDLSVLAGDRLEGRVRISDRKAENIHRCF